MDYQKLIQQVSELYNNWGEKSMSPKVEDYSTVLSQIETSLNANIIALLNCAIDYLEEEEIYCQVGCCDSGGLIGALLNHPDLIIYTIAPEIEEERLEKITNDLAVFDYQDQVIYCPQQLEEFFIELGEVTPQTRIGVYFCNNASDYRSQLLSLLLVRPFLAEKALIIINNSNLSMVQQASYDFLTLCSQGKLILDLATPRENHYTFGNGIYVISWEEERGQAIDWVIIEAQFRNKPAIKALAELNNTFEGKQKQQIIQTLRKEALAYGSTKQYQAAIEKYQEALEWNKYDADIWDELGMVYYDKNEIKSALECLNKALYLEYGNSTYHYHVGLIFMKIGELEKAQIAYEKAIEIDATNVYACNNLANLFYRKGEEKKAEEIYSNAIKINPNEHTLYFNFGNLMLTENNLDDAITLFNKCLNLKPKQPEVLEKLGIAFEKKGDLDEANAYFGHAAYRRKEYQQAINYFELVDKDKDEDKDIYFYVNYADCLQELNRLEDAINIYHQGINHYPDDEILYFKFIIFLQQMGMIQEAIDITNQALQVLPHSLLLKVQNQRLLPIVYESVEEIEQYRQRFQFYLNELTKDEDFSLELLESRQKALQAFFINSNGYLYYQGKNDLELQVQYGKILHQVMVSNYPELSQPLKMPLLKKGEKIRIGFISACFYHHSGTKWSLGWMKYLNNQEFEVYCYHTGFVTDNFTQIFSNYSKFYHIYNDFEALIQQIKTDNLHILIYPELLDNPATFKVATLRLAPVQCTAWGITETSGLPTIDYYLSSDVMEPENGQEHYSEQLIRLPNLGFCYSRPILPELKQTRDNFGLDQENIIYLCSQSVFKYLPMYDYVFAEIAQKVPLSRFIFVGRKSKTLNEKLESRLKIMFEKYKLNFEDHCVFLQSMYYSPDYLNLNLVSDVFLDSFCFSGLYTTLDAIACNLPVVTYPGELLKGRQSYGILKLLELEETIAKDEADYINIAVRLGLDEQWRQGIVEKIKANQHRIYDDTTCVRALEDFFCQVVAQGTIEADNC